MEEGGRKRRMEEAIRRGNLKVFGDADFGYYFWENLREKRKEIVVTEEEKLEEGLKSRFKNCSWNRRNLLLSSIVCGMGV